MFHQISSGHSLIHSLTHSFIYPFTLPDLWAHMVTGYMNTVYLTIIHYMNQDLYVMYTHHNQHDATLV